MRRARSRPPGLQLPEEFAGGRRRRGAGAILKSDPQSLSLCVSRRRPPEDRELSPLKREGVEDSAAGGRDSWRRHGGFGARPALLSLSILLRHFLARRLPEGRGRPLWYPEPARGCQRSAPAVGTPPSCAMPAGGQRGGRRNTAKRQ